MVILQRLLVAELGLTGRDGLQRANDLVSMKIHPTSIISGYRLAQKEAVKFINSKMSSKVAVMSAHD